MQLSGVCQSDGLFRPGSFAASAGEASWLLSNSAELFLGSRSLFFSYFGDGVEVLPASTLSVVPSSLKDFFFLSPHMRLLESSTLNSEDF